MTDNTPGGTAAPQDKGPGWTGNPIPVANAPTPAGQAPEKIEIEVVDDTPPADRNRPPRDPKTPPLNVSDEEIAKYSETAQKRIKTLRYEFHEERRQREAAVRERDELVRVAQSWQQRAAQTEQALATRQAEFVEQSRTRSVSEISLAQSALAAAIEAGKSDEIAKAQAALTRAITQQEMLPARPAAPVAPVQPQQPAQQWQPQQPPAQSSAPDPKAVNWLKANPWFGSDKKMTGYAYGVHEELVTEKGIDPRSDEYYAEVNKAMKAAFPDEFDDGRAPAAPSRPSIVAPPDRGSAPRKVQLTATQAAIAKRLGITLEQYAKQLVKEQKANG